MDSLGHGLWACRSCLPKSFFDTSLIDLDYRGQISLLPQGKGSVEGNSGGNLENARGTNGTLEGGLKRGGQPPPSFLSRSRSFSASASSLSSAGLRSGASDHQSWRYACIINTLASRALVFVSRISDNNQGSRVLRAFCQNLSESGLIWEWRRAGWDTSP